MLVINSKPKTCTSLPLLSYKFPPYTAFLIKCRPFIRHFPFLLTTSQSVPGHTVVTNRPKCNRLGRRYESNDATKYLLTTIYKSACIGYVLRYLPRRFWLNNPRALFSMPLFACLLTFAAVEDGISTFSRVMTKGLTEQFSSVPHFTC